ncbi:MAG: Bicoid-interacting protein 3-domain-containing protein [Benniella sp.]|nr:MAG: Bicoid-interacting protein 3-domain-containing protein [Benniella sp.]
MTLSELAKKVDIRFEFLDPSWFRGKKVLDIGCNSALLTIFIAVHYKPCKIQGVDIDPSLIGKAQSFILKTFSQISPQAYKQQTRHHEDTQGTTMTTTTTTTTATTGDDDVPYEEYFPRALHKIHGFLPVPPRRPETEKLFPHNIELRVADWATETGNQQEAEGEQWDVILAFSLTKWIHLHGGDAGMKAFFQKIYRSLSPGGIMLLEPQAFETYNKRSKILPEMSANYKSIQFKPDQFQAYLLGPEVGFKEVVHLGHSEGSAKNFNRDIFLYRK